MKIAASRVDQFIRSPDPDVRAILIYGPDGGLIRERSDMLARQIVDDLDDPFRVAELDPAALKDDPARFADEAAAIAMTGGRRVVRLRSAGDRQAIVIADFLSDPLGDSLILVEAGELAPRSALRKAFETSKIAAALPCYPDEGSALGKVIGETAAALGLTMEPAALRYLAAVLGGDRLMTRSEIDKLALYMGDETLVTLAHVGPVSATPLSSPSTASPLPPPAATWRQSSAAWRGPILRARWRFPCCAPRRAICSGCTLWRGRRRVAIRSTGRSNPSVRYYTSN